MPEPALLCAHCGYQASVAQAQPCPTCDGVVASAVTRAAIRPGTGLFVTDVLHGFVTFWRGLIWLFTRVEYARVLRWSVLVNVLAFAVIFLVFWFGVHRLFVFLASLDWGVFGGLREIFSFTGPGLALITTILSLWLLAPALIELVSEPFADALAQRTEQILVGRPVRAIELGYLQSIRRSFGTTLRIVLAELILLVPLLLLSLLGIGILLGALIAAVLAGVSWLGVPCSRRNISYGQRLALAKTNWARLLGFGLAFEVGMLVPFFNLFLLIPSSVVGISILFFYFDKSPRAEGALSAPDCPARPESPPAQL